MQRRQAFTIVELMVATTVTLLLILAMAQAFSVVSVTVSLNRAILEMSGQLRGVAFRLQQDLEGHTAPTSKPWLSSSSGLGYFEYFDGPSSDVDWNANGFPDKLEIPNTDWNGNGTVEAFEQVMKDTSVGDLDDVLMFTSKSVETPFIGQLGNARFQSQFAEIVWWLSYDNKDGDVVRDVDEPLTLFRRALLIRPDLNKLDPSPPTGIPNRYLSRLPVNPNNWYNISSDLPQMVNDVLAIYNDYDLSVHFVRHETSNGVALYVVANSLSDLTLRQNRFCHDPIVYRQPVLTGSLTYVGNSNFPVTFHPYPLNRDYVTVHSRYLDPSVGGSTGAGVIEPMISLRYVIRATTSTRYGEEVVLPNALAFDVRAYDPTALVSLHAGNDGAMGTVDDEAVEPGDWGYGAGGSVNIAASPPKPAAKNIEPTSRGAYVDLSFYNKLQVTGYPSSYAAALFGPQPSYRSSLYGAQNSSKGSGFDSGTWDTYPLDLENDGINQDGDTPTDEGENDVDDDGSNGVDDEDEKETNPPYNAPLRGIRVRIRMIEPDTRQTRQATVISRFTVD